MARQSKIKKALSSIGNKKPPKNLKTKGTVKIQPAKVVSPEDIINSLSDSDLFFVNVQLSNDEYSSDEEMAIHWNQEGIDLEWAKIIIAEYRSKFRTDPFMELEKTNNWNTEQKAKGGQLNASLVGEELEKFEVPGKATYYIFKYGDNQFIPMVRPHGYALQSITKKPYDDKESVITKIKQLIKRNSGKPVSQIQTFELGGKTDEQSATSTLNTGVIEINKSLPEEIYYAFFALNKSFVDTIIKFKQLSENKFRIENQKGLWMTVDKAIEPFEDYKEVILNYLKKLLSKEKPVDYGNKLPKQVTYSVTYQKVTPESAEDGDFSDTGFEIEPETEDLEDVLRKIVHRFGAYGEPQYVGGGLSFRSLSPDQNFQTGEDTYYTAHINGLTEEQADQIINLIKDGRAPSHEQIYGPDEEETSPEEDQPDEIGEKFILQGKYPDGRNVRVMRHTFAGTLQNAITRAEQILTDTSGDWQYNTMDIINSQGAIVKTISYDIKGRQFTYKDGENPEYAKGGKLAQSPVLDFGYIALRVLPNSLEVKLTESGKEKLAEDGLDYINFADYTETMQGNSEWLWYPDLGEAGFGLTNSPGFTEGYYFDDKGELTEDGNGSVYYYNNYMITDPLQVLKETGKVVFDKHNEFAKGGKLSKEDAYHEAIKLGVDFDQDFHAQPKGNELSDLAKKAGYRKPATASGSTGRYFFEHLKNLLARGKFKAKVNPPAINDSNTVQQGSRISYIPDPLEDDIVVGIVDEISSYYARRKEATIPLYGLWIEEPAYQEPTHTWIGEDSVIKVDNSEIVPNLEKIKELKALRAKIKGNKGEQSSNKELGGSVEPELTIENSDFSGEAIHSGDVNQPVYNSGGNIDHKILLERIIGSSTEKKSDSQLVPESTTQILDISPNIVFDTPKEIFEYLAKTFWFSANPLDYKIGEDGALTYTEMYDKNGKVIKLNDSLYQLWKEGKAKLFQYNYSIYLSYAKTTAIPERDIKDYFFAKFQIGGIPDSNIPANNQPIDQMKPSNVVLPENVTQSMAYEQGGQTSRIPNSEAHVYTENRLPFIGNNLEGKLLPNGDYVVLSMGHYPIWFFDQHENKWYGNQDKVKQEIAMHCTYSRPSWDTTLVSHKDLTSKMLQGVERKDLGGLMFREQIPQVDGITILPTDNTAIAHGGNLNLQA